MATCITGMHRSGTSMVAKLLYLSGLYLGPEEELIPATPDNPDGHWENAHFIELNDEILNELGGGWDHPPPLPDGWYRSRTDCQSVLQRLLPLKEKAAALIEQFLNHEPWGWKDPRTSLTLPFWKSLLPGLKVVICLRNPLEVALSLRRRGLSSYALSLDLWRIYSEHILHGVPPERRLITHYDRYFSDPEPELRRVLAFLDMPASQDDLRRGCSAARTELRHSRFTARHLLSADVSPEVLRLYVQMQEDANWNDSDPARRPQQQDVTEPPAEGEGRPVDATALDLALLRRDQEELRRRLAGRDDTIQQLQQQLTTLRQERERLQQTIVARAGELDGFRATLLDLREQLRSRDEEIQTTLDELKATQLLSGPDRATASAKVAYRQLVRRIRAAVRQAVPPDATVILVSKGDDELLKLDGRRAWHFPQTSDGIYAGHNPANSLAAIAHLEALRAMEGQFLVFPQTALWWLEHYGEFKRHLDRRYRLIVNQPDRCLIYALHQRPVLQQALWPIEFANLVSDCQARLDQLPAILDWDTGLELATTFPQYTVFCPPKADDKLPYLDRSIDLVAVSAARPSSFAEARRVAGLAVVTVPAKNGADHDNGLAVEWLSETAGANPPSTSIIIPCYNGIAYTEACLSTLKETLPASFRGEIIIVDDASTDDTPVRLQQLAEADKRFIILRNSANAGFVATSNRGAQAASGELLVFLNNDTVLLPDWLAPLWQIFRAHPDAGAAGGKLLFDDGRLQEAGACVFQDGSAAKIGYADPDAEAPFYKYVRQVDYCSGALLATKRVLFEELGGFDPHFQPGYYEDVDYCFRLRQRGYRTYYQPLSAIVHLEGATAGTDLSKGHKRFQVANQCKFVEKWSHVLKRHSPRPNRLDSLALTALVDSNEPERNGSP